jgi:[ribosomal protein S18]-alanine N-acetyltransferase
LSLLIRRMAKQDIPQIARIDREAFPTMWPPINFGHELGNKLAYYVVACDGEQMIENPQPAIRLVAVKSFLGIKWPFGSKQPESEPEIEKVDLITGFLGLWMMVDEAHIINIAVKNSHRGRGIGELLLIAGIDLAYQLKALTVTLEVRAGNMTAQNLYTKYGFNKVGIRKGYYTDNKEDAIIMTTDVITTPHYERKFTALKEAHLYKLGQPECKLA